MIAARERPVTTCLATTTTVRRALEGLLAADCLVSSGSLSEGYLIVQDAGVKVYQALQKGADQPWIVGCYKSDRINWS
jgi:hypothetical protein